MVTELISKPDGHLFILAQPEHLEGLNLAAILPYTKNSLHIQHIICINNRKGYIRSQQNYNIQCLKKIISLYEKPVTYEPYYYYDNVNSYGLSAEPCLIPCFTKDLLEKYIPDSLPQKETLMQELPMYIESLIKSNSHMYFTREGVLNFLMTGKLHEIPDALYSPFEYEDRIRLLKKFYEQVNASNNIRLLKGPLEKFPLNLHLAVTVNYGYLMFSGQTSMLTYILLKEQHLLSSFYDFASSLDEMEMLETKDETLNYLQRVLEMNKE